MCLRVPERCVKLIIFVKNINREKFVIEIIFHSVTMQDDRVKFPSLSPALLVYFT